MSSRPHYQVGLIELRECTVPALRVYNRLMQQEFVRFTDEQELLEKMEIAIKTFNSLVTEYSVLPKVTQLYHLLNSSFFFFF